MLKLKLQYLATSCEELTHWKRLWCWEGLGAGGEGDDREWGGWMASLTGWTRVWVNSRSWWWTQRPGVLRFMGLQRVGHDWATELNWEDRKGVREEDRKGRENECSIHQREKSFKKCTVFWFFLDSTYGSMSQWPLVVSILVEINLWGQKEQTQCHAYTNSRLIIQSYTHTQKKISTPPNNNWSLTSTGQVLSDSCPWLSIFNVIFTICAQVSGKQTQKITVQILF